jgi:hypothetical protein
MTHEMRKFVEGFAIVVKKNGGIYSCMYDKERDQEQSGKSHRIFFTKRGKKKLFPGHKRRLI